MHLMMCNRFEGIGARLKRMHLSFKHDESQKEYCK